MLRSHMKPVSTEGKCSREAALSLVMNNNRIALAKRHAIDNFIRYTQTAVASFGPKRKTDCGKKPAGFTRLTPEVLDWVKSKTGMYHPGINDPGMVNVNRVQSVDFVLAAVIITGGIERWRMNVEQSAELYHPRSKSACVLPDLPDERVFHTQDGSLLCGGGDRFGKGEDTRRSCRRWNPDTGFWEIMTESLTEPRLRHTSWTPTKGSVTYLMGGWSDNTSEVVDLNKANGITSTFPLKHDTEYKTEVSC